MDRELRIGFVCVEDARDVKAWSGIPFHVLKALEKLGVKVEVYSPLNRDARYLLGPARLLDQLRGASSSVEHYRVMLRSYAWQISRAMRDRPVDVVLATSSIPVTALTCSQPILFWTDAVFHGMQNYYEGFGGTPGALRRGKRQEEAALRNCTYAVYASEWAATTARQLTDSQKIKVLPFGANLAIDHTLADVEQLARQRRRERPRSCELLFLGKDWDRKGGQIAVDVAKILNDRGVPTRLTVAGYKTTEPPPEYVRSLGFISKETSEGQDLLRSLLRGSDFLILPTRAEAAGIVFCEASAFGLPSLSYQTGGVPDYVRDGVNGVCLPFGTPRAGFADAIERLLSNPERYDALCLGAFHEYKTRLNWGTSVSALVDLCRRAVDEAASLR